MRSWRRRLGIAALIGMVKTVEEEGGIEDEIEK
jgi:hypothetical protein